MDIGSTNVLMSLEKIQPREYLAGKDRPTCANASGQDKVEMSNYGRNASRLFDLISTVPDVRESSVDAAVLAIESGVYQNVKAEHIAEKILRGDFLNEYF